MIKDCLVDIHDVKVLIKYDESIKLYDILHSLNDKCRFKVNRNKFDCHDLVIELVNWTKDETFDRLGFRKKDKEIRIPIKKNRDVGILVDVAVLDYKLRRGGKDYSSIFNEKIYDRINKKNKKDKKKYDNRYSIHGVLLEIEEKGILIIGESGVGKSEVALELVSKGNKFVADDKVTIKSIYNGKILRGYCTEVPYYIEVRGLGIVNVAEIYGKEYVKSYTNIDTIIEIVEDCSIKNNNNNTMKILGNKLPIRTLTLCSTINLVSEIEELIKDI